MNNNLINNNHYVSLITRIWQQLSAKRRSQFALLFILMVGCSFLETLSVASVVPFLQLLSNPRLVSTNLISSAGHYLYPTDGSQLTSITITFCFTVVIAAAARMMLLWSSTRISFAVGHDFSVAMYKNALHQPYHVHINKNSSEIISGIFGKVQEVIGCLNVILNMFTSLILLFAITSTLLIIDPIPALIAFSGFSVIYLIIITSTRQRLRRHSFTISKNSTEVIKTIQEGLSGIRDVLLDGSQNTFVNIYTKADIALKHAQARNAFIGASPRFAVEALGTVLIAMLALSIVDDANDVTKAIPTLGLIAMGAQRLLPTLQTLYAGWTSIQGGYDSIMDALYLLERPPLDQAPRSEVTMTFRDRIELRNVHFKYENRSPDVIRGLNLTIKKGNRIGFIGTTGCGKSTLMDIIMGLLSPTEGCLLVDGTPLSSTNYRSWQNLVAHVPQSIFLSDTTIAENIAFGVEKEKIDLMLVMQAAEQAQIAEAIEGWKDAYETMVGERGVRLSGGQRQRIGIARALYRRAQVIIFDEATSALDEKTEQDVMRSISALDSSITVLIIAHRHTTLRECSHVYHIENGSIT